MDEFVKQSLRYKWTVTVTEWRPEKECGAKAERERMMERLNQEIRWKLRKLTTKRGERSILTKALSYIRPTVVVHDG